MGKNRRGDTNISEERKKRKTKKKQPRKRRAMLG